MDHPNDGPAFPTGSVSQNQATGETIVHQPIGGMSKRELFAAILMHSEAVTCGVPGEAADALIEVAQGAGRDVEDQMARNAVVCADALLRALAEPKPEPAPRFPVFYTWAASEEQKDALRTLHTRTWFEQLPADLRTYVTDAMSAIARAEAGEDDIPF